MNTLLSAKEVLSKMRKREPLSLVRYGDGEAIVLNGFKDLESLKAVCRRQFGYTPQIDHVEQIRENLIEVYKGADIIGIPGSKGHKEEGSYWERATTILRQNTSDNILQEKQLTSIDIHSHFLDNNYYDILLGSVATLNYISCRDLDEQFKQKYPNLKTINRFQIAPEVKFTTNTTGERHYPDQFNKVEKWMDRAINCERSICLVGAGVVGKIYCNWFRDRGGVAMDIGSIFDSFAGYATRGPNRGMNVIDDQHKL